MEKSDDFFIQHLRVYYAFYIPSFLLFLLIERKKTIINKTYFIDV